jgi:hypothetical protein
LKQNVNSDNTLAGSNVKISEKRDIEGGFNEGISLKNKIS